MAMVPRINFQFKMPMQCHIATLPVGQSDPRIGTFMLAYVAAVFRPCGPHCSLLSAQCSVLST